MLKDKVKSSYVQALLDIAREENIFNPFYKNAKLTITLLDKNPQLGELLNSYNIDDENKHQLIEKAFDKSFNKVFVNFIHLLIAKNKTLYLERICKEFVEVVDFTNGINRGTLYTTFLLTKEEIIKIEKIISDKLAKKVILTNKLDKQLLGGLRVEVGDYVIDQSVKSHFDSLRDFEF